MYWDKEFISKMDCVQTPKPQDKLLEGLKVLDEMMVEGVVVD